jgi:hypothetical protein
LQKETQLGASNIPVVVGVSVRFLAGQHIEEQLSKRPVVGDRLIVFSRRDKLPDIEIEEVLKRSIQLGGFEILL